MQGIKVLIVDDDLELRQVTERVFGRAGAQVLSASNGLEAMRKFYANHPDLVILDIVMPGDNGWEICRQIRNLSDVPVIMLTALHQDDEIIRGLEVGADDFISKPYNQNVLLARARAVLRRRQFESPQSWSSVYSDGYLAINLEEHRITVQGEPVKLTPTEYQLLEYLFRHAGRMMTFDQILENVWGWEYKDSPDYVHVYISHLRQKIEQDPKKPRYLLTEHGTGYRFEKHS